MTAQRWHAGPAFGNTFKDIRNHSSTTFFVAAILCLPSLFASVIVSSGAPLVGIPLQIVALFPSAIWLPVAIITATKLYATGTDPGVGRLLDETASWRLFSYLGTTLLLFLILALSFVVAFIPLIGVAASSMAGAGGSFTQAFTGGNGVLSVLTLLFGIALAITFSVVIYLRYGLAPVVNVLEHLSPRKSLTRSREIMKGRWMDLFVLFAMVVGVSLVAYIVILGPSLVVTFSSVRNAPSSGPFFTPRLGPVAAVVSGLSTYLHSIILTVISTGCLANFYLGVKGDEVMESRQQQLAGIDVSQAVGPAPPSFDGDQLNPLAPQGQPDPGEQQKAPGDDQEPG
jgi:uncharacterized membrane protein